MSGIPFESYVLDGIFKGLSESLSEVSEYVWPPTPPPPSYGQGTKAELLAEGMREDLSNMDFFIPACELWRKNKEGTDYVASDNPRYVTILQLKTCSVIFEHLIKEAVDQTKPELSLKLIDGWSLGDDASHHHIRGMRLKFEMSQKPEATPSVQWIDGDGVDMTKWSCRKLWPHTADFGFAKLAEMSADEESRLKRSLGADMQGAFAQFFAHGEGEHGSGECGDFEWESSVGPGKSANSITYKLELSHMG